MIKIGLDAKRIVRNGTGLGSYGRTLANDLAALGANASERLNSDIPTLGGVGSYFSLDITLYAPDKGRDALRCQVAEGANIRYAYPQGPGAWLGKSFWRSRGIVGQLRRDGIEVYHGLSGELPWGLRESGIRSVVTIHDLIFLRHPEYYKPADVAIYTRKFRHALQEADAVVAISECTRRDICELGGISGDRVKVVYQSCAPRFSAVPDMRLLWRVRDTYDLPDRYILCVGSIERRKNQLAAVQALHRLPDDVSLLLVGRATPYTREIGQYIEREGLQRRVSILHGVPDEHLPAIYRLAEAFVYPSRYEGFGIPIIEAIRMGLPVVACTGSCLEEAGGPDCLYAPPDDNGAIAHALSQVLTGAPGREQRIESAKQYIRRFENTGAAQRFADIYGELMEP